MVDQARGARQSRDDGRTAKHDMPSPSVSETSTVELSWTPEQSEAIHTRGCEILVAAGAGAGKTAVLVERVIQGILREDVGLDMERLLVVTFTEAAATEMRQRIRETLEDELQQDPRNMRLQQQLARLPLASISTIHAFCSQLLRRYFYYLGLDPGFRIMAEAEASLLRYEVVDQILAQYYLKGDHAVLDFIDAYGGAMGDEGIKELILRLYDFQMSLPEPEAWQQAVLGAFLPDSVAAFHASAFMQEAERQVELELTQIVSLLAHALDTCFLPDGPERYAERLREEKAAVVRLSELVENQHWDAVHDWSDPFASLPRISKTMQVDDELKERCQSLRNAAKDSLKKLYANFFSRTEAEIIGEMMQLAPTVELIFQLVDEFANAYGKAKQNQGTLDFADLEQLALRLLTVPAKGGGLAPSAIALELQHRFDEILIDEYQDTNGVQDCILAMVAGAQEQGLGTTPRFMVGDIKQSIYGFRLTDPTLFLTKYQEYSPLQGAPQRRIDLATNFRCRKEVIHGINFIFRQLMTSDIAGISYDDEAELKYGATYAQLAPDMVEVAAAEETPGPIVDNGREYLEFYLLDAESHRQGGDLALHDDVNDTGEKSEDLVGNDVEELEQLEREAWLIARRIHRLVSGGMESGNEESGEVQGRPTVIWDKSLKAYRPVEYRDIVVLMRSVRNRANQVMEIFRQAGIPAYADLGSGYFAAIEVKLMVALLQVLDNPQQDIPLAAVLRAPWVALSDQELALVRLNEPRGSFYEAVRAAARQPDGLGQRLSQILDSLDNWRTAARRLPLSQLIGYLYQETGFYDYAGSMPKGEQRQANLRGLHDRAREFDQFAGRGLFRFVRFLEKLQEEDDLGEVRPLGEGENVVRVMSMHKSKGLEFPVVFLADLGKGFNLQDLKGDVLIHKDLGLGLNVIDANQRFRYGSLSHEVIRGRLHRDTLAEEMRVLYVAMTRARERLILVGSTREVARNCARWTSGAEMEGWQLSSDLLISAKHYLDWLGPALSRHQAGHILRLAGGMQDRLPADEELTYDQSNWHVWVEGHSEPLSWLQFLLEGEKQTIPWQEISKLQPIHTPQLTDDVRERFADHLLWQYPAQRVVNLPAKVSVTELKRWMTAEDGSDDPDSAWQPSLANGRRSRGTQHVARRPRFILAQRDRISAVERGIWTHALLQHLDLTKDLTNLEVLRAEAMRIVQQQLLTEKQLAAVDLESIGYFFQGALGKRLLRNPAGVRREVSFMLAVPVEEIYGQMEEDRDHVVIQGVIDCLVEEPNGFLLVDFKTDRITPQNIAEVAAAYRVQVEQYCRAVEAVFGQQVWQSYLYFLQGRLAMKMG